MPFISPDTLLNLHLLEKGVLEFEESREGVVAKKKKRGIRISTILLIIVFAAGISLLLYPTISDWWNSFHQTQVITTYSNEVDNLNEETYAALLESAEEYNEWLFTSGHGLGLDDDELEEYEAQLSFGTTSVIAYIEIPKIDVYLPIYHGTSDSVLSSGIGHLEGSSLPVGGMSTHCVLSGHRGLVSSKLFTDIDELEIGDTFIIHVLGETLTYEVDQILIVLPTETSALQIEEGEDLVTLLTCTPYGINTHRLLVRGHRVENESEITVTADATQVDTTSVASGLAAAVLVVLFIIVMIRSGRKRKTNKRSKNKEK